MTNFEFSSTIIGKVSDLSGGFSGYSACASQIKTLQQKVHQIGWFYLLELRMGPLKSRNDLVLTIFAMIFTLDESFTLKFHFEKSRPGRAAAERQYIARARVKSKHLQQKVHQIGWFYLLELRMGPLKSRNDLVLTIFAMIFTLDESFTLKFHFEKSRPGRAAAERQLPGNLPDCWIAYQ